MAFETITERNLDSVVCGICGVCPEVCLGDGNEKNCCNNSQITYTKENKQHGSMISFEELLSRITSRAIEKAVYTRNENAFNIKIEELPPIMPDAMRDENTINSKHMRNRVPLKSSQYDGDPAKLHQLIKAKQLDIDNLKEMSLDTIKDICQQCSISTQRKSKTTLVGNIYSLYASITIGLSPCHNFSKLPGKAGGFYHIVCRHGCTVASKFLGLTESVRDAADLCLSLKYKPIVFINDTPCRLARHMECRCPDICANLWGNRWLF
ncbi:HMG domain-containing protein 3-like [Dendronephthya gigantea]|uniref:HMG domain-containing protein 3-like n=1 Tax=Dendronephthya gigantea TaxID=151771 RepID=UPI00106BA6D5|nr:HMG domain-containing protein 3-like [Dendronephthya gigantea]